MLFYHQKTTKAWGESVAAAQAYYRSNRIGMGTLGSELKILYCSRDNGINPGYIWIMTNMNFGDEFVPEPRMDEVAKLF